MVLNTNCFRQKSSSSITAIWLATLRICIFILMVLRLLMRWLVPILLLRVFKLMPTASIFYVEAYVIPHAICYASASTYGRCWIYTDSWSVLKALQCCLHTFVYDDLVLLNKYALHVATLQGMHVFLSVLPSHFGISGNEMVYSIAKLACHSPLSLEKCHTAGLLSLAHLSVRKLEEQQWLVANGDRPYGRIQLHIQQVPWFWTHRRSRRFFTTLSRLRLNHGNFKSHLHCISLCEDTRCDCGANIEDMNHILFQCPLMKGRDNFLAFLWQCGFFCPYHLSTLLSTSDMEIYEDIYGFLHRNKRCIYAKGQYREMRSVFSRVCDVAYLGFDTG
ncbi:hypothetical protein PR048_007962 [Dryococelus australis]|uniref:Reverse transcriptase zinc-binding domain-containing protein n=1 Tax=Dryococelus australis TaxID=614101 RepID=A0ABQ9HW35_9NEOP|nr:hypothetical protein PR048_007962 [Dryococelus australis]